MKNGYPELLLGAIVIVAFIAGYAIVSFVVKIFKRDMSPTGTADQTRNDSTPVDTGIPVNKADAGAGDHRAMRADQFRDWKEMEAKRRQASWDAAGKKQNQ